MVRIRGGLWLELELRGGVVRVRIRGGVVRVRMGIWLEYGTVTQNSEGQPQFRLGFAHKFGFTQSKITLSLQALKQYQDANLASWQWQVGVTMWGLGIIITGFTGYLKSILLTLSLPVSVPNRQITLQSVLSKVADITLSSFTL